MINAIVMNIYNKFLDGWLKRKNQILWRNLNQEEYAPFLHIGSQTDLEDNLFGNYDLVKKYEESRQSLKLKEFDRPVIA